jgi:murein DD-endopeptidase MepM/ murein hydrolase activator NlpD
MTLTYQRPAKLVSIGDTFAKHVRRGSVNAGVDYKLPYGTPVYAIADGTIATADTGNGGAGGRTIAINFADGHSADYLHLSNLTVRKGQKVTRGQIIGHSGASGFGDDWHYGAHLHLSFRNGDVHYQNSHNLDFEAFYRARAIGSHDPNVKREVYRLAGSKPARYYLVGNPKRWNTRIYRLARFTWIPRYGYGGIKTMAQILAAEAALKSKYPAA